MQQLRLQQRHVHVRRAFALAGLAGQTVLQRLVQLGRSQPVGSVVQPSLDGGADGIRPTTGGHDVFAGGNKGGAHGGRRFAASAAAIALLDVPHEALVLGHIFQAHLERQLAIGHLTARPLAQVAVDGDVATGKNLAGIHERLRVELALDARHELEQFRPEVLAHELGARHAHAVFRRKRPLELERERAYALGQLPKLLDVRRVVHIHNRAHMQQAAGSVAIEGRLQPHGLHQGQQAAHVVGQLRRGHGHVFNARRGLRVSLATGQQRQARLA